MRFVLTCVLGMMPLLAHSASLSVVSCTVGSMSTIFEVSSSSASCSFNSGNGYDMRGYATQTSDTGLSGFSIALGNQIDVMQIDNRPAFLPTTDPLGLHFAASSYGLYSFSTNGPTRAGFLDFTIQNYASQTTPGATEFAEITDGVHTYELGTCSEAIDTISGGCLSGSCPPGEPFLCYAPSGPVPITLGVPLSVISYSTIDEHLDSIVVPTESYAFDRVNFSVTEANGTADYLTRVADQAVSPEPSTFLMLTGPLLVVGFVALRRDRDSSATR